MSRASRSDRRRWMEWEREFLRRRYPDTLSEHLAIVLGRTRSAVCGEAAKLGLSKSPEWIAQRAREAMADPNHGGRRGQFKKGNVPWTAGTKGQGLAGKHPNSAANHYRPGQYSGRAAELVMPLGSYRVNADGIVDIKVSMKPGPQNHRWQPVHRVVWEAEHGPIPRGHAVVFRPGRKTTDPAAITTDALELVTQAELMRRNSVHRHGPELARLTQLRAVLVRAINTKAKEAAEAS